MDLEGRLDIQMCRITPKLYVTSAIETPLRANSRFIDLTLLYKNLIQECYIYESVICNLLPVTFMYNIVSWR